MAVMEYQYVCLAPLLYLIRSDLPQDGILICHKIRTLSDIIPFVFSFAGVGGSGLAWSTDVHSSLVPIS
jgi:hypothetical protein